jgi:hypothetical protein
MYPYVDSVYKRGSQPVNEAILFNLKEERRQLINVMATAAEQGQNEIVYVTAGRLVAIETIIEEMEGY